jgi:hypothetical protein
MSFKKWDDLGVALCRILVLHIYSGAGPFLPAVEHYFPQTGSRPDLLDFNAADLVMNEVRMGGACRFWIPSPATLLFLTGRNWSCRS